MPAFPAAKRTPFLVLTALLLFSVSPAVAGDGSGYLGVMLQDVSPSMAKALQLGDETGILINEVVADSPAAAAGLEVDPLDQARCLVYFKPNQIYFLLTAAKTAALAAAGELDRAQWIDSGRGRRIRVGARWASGGRTVPTCSSPWRWGWPSVGSVAC